MSLQDLCWKVRVTAKAADTPPELAKLIPGAQSFFLDGIAVTDEKNANNWALKPGELDGVAAQLKDTGNSHVQLRVNHGSDVQDVCGRVLTAEHKGNDVPFHARITTADPKILVPVISGDVDHVSIQLDAATAECSVCGKEIDALRPCGCKDAHTVISNVKVRELSIVADPAYERTHFAPMGFAAAVTNHLAEVRKLAEEKNEKKAEEELKQKLAESEEERKKLSEKLKKAEEELKKAKKSQEEEEEEKKKAAKLPGRAASTGAAVPNPNLMDMAMADINKFFASRGVRPGQQG
jgi:hypothetical protein